MLRQKHKNMTTRNQNRIKRHKRVRAKVKGTAKVPRLCVFKSLQHIYVQLIDDEKNKVLASASDFEVKAKTKKDASAGVGKLIASEAKKIKIEKVVFDRGGFVYHGRIKAVADGAREGGLKF